jgi:hypothetical protein
MLAAVIRGSVGVREGKQCSQHFSPRYVTRGQSFAHTAKTWGPGPELALTLRQTRTFEMQGSACWPIELLSLFWLCFALASAIMQTCCINVFAKILPLTFSIYTYRKMYIHSFWEKEILGKKVGGSRVLVVLKYSIVTRLTTSCLTSLSPHDEQALGVQVATTPPHGITTLDVQPCSVKH